MSRKEREEGFRRDLVLDFAETLFAEKGFEGTTVAEIADRAELAKGSLYQLFESKDEIFSAMVRRRMEQVFGDLEEFLANENSPSEKIRELIIRKFQLFRENRDFAQIFMNECKGFHLQLSSRLIEGHRVHARKYMDMIKAVIEDGQACGEFRKDVSSSILLAALGGITNGVIVKWLDKPEEIDLDQAIEKMADIFIHGAGNNT